LRRFLARFAPGPFELSYDLLPRLLRLHDLRHSFASVGAAANNSLLILGKLLGHRHAATTERYAHLAADPMQRVAETIGQRISTALAGKGDPSDSNVRRLRGSAMQGPPRER
jgi:integrase